tara:strand:+ start:290 stop:547 length:258 start_codon:yes stop_codon:yes gene_type:complete
MQTNLYTQLREANPNALTLPFFEDAYIGFSLQAGERALATYDYDLCIASIMRRKKMKRIDAIEYFVDNVAEIYEGRNTPLILVRH